MMCYAWRPNPSYSTSPPCGAETAGSGGGPASGASGQSGLFGLSWTTLALIAGGALLLFGGGRR